MNTYDLGISAQFAELVHRIQKEKLNPEWVEFMMQRIIENDHSGDRAFCKTFLTLKRPTLREVADLLDIPQENYERPFGKGMRERIQGIPLGNGPDEVDVVKVDWRTLFERNLSGWSERSVRERSHELLGLVPCPAWVVPALGVASLRVHKNKKTGFTQMMVCLPESEQTKYGGFNVIYGNHWWIHGRPSSLETTWNNTTWLMAKPFPGWTA